MCVKINTYTLREKDNYHIHLYISKYYTFIRKIIFNFKMYYNNITTALSALKLIVHQRKLIF